MVHVAETLGRTVLTLEGVTSLGPLRTGLPVRPHSNSQQGPNLLCCRQELVDDEVPGVGTQTLVVDINREFGVLRLGCGGLLEFLVITARLVVRVPTPDKQEEGEDSQNFHCFGHLQDKYKSRRIFQPYLNSAGNFHVGTDQIFSYVRPAGCVAVS